MQLNPTMHHASIHDFYIHHRSWLYSRLCKKLGSTFEAADVTQDTFLRVLTKTDLSAILEPRAYLTTIAHGLIVSQIRRREIERAYLCEMTYLSESHYPSAEARAITLELLVNIDSMLNGLPLKVRKAFIYSQVEALTHAQIAAKLSVSVASVRLYLAKAMTQCLAISEE